MDDKKLEKIMKRIGEGQEIRRAVEFRAEKSAEGRMVVVGYATTFDDPYVLWSEPGYEVIEQIDRHALDEADQTDVIFQYDHMGRVFARTRNDTLKLSTDDHGYKTEADVTDSDGGPGIYRDINGGFIDRMSWRFRVAEDKREVTEDRETGKITVLRTITKVAKVYDVSCVSIPANDGTDISARSFADGVIGELKAERLEQARREELRKRLMLKLNL